MNVALPSRRPPIGQPLTEPLLAVRGLRRRFGETLALDDCSIEILPGEIHALVGENGSGKSTLIKILSGILQPDEGAIDWRGGRVRLDTPWHAQRLGLGTVFQETLVLDELSVRDNVMLGVDPRVNRRHGVPEEVLKVGGILRRLGLDALEVERPVGSLPLAQRQLISIARSLARPWKLLILDESTSALDVEDRDRLFELLRTYRSEGRSILFVSHRMDEIANLVDRSTVLRSGRSVATLRTAEAPTERLLELMSSKQAVEAAEGHAPTHRTIVQGKPVLSIRGMSLRPGSRPFDLDVRPGEIFGVAGLEGHGQAALLEIAGGRLRGAGGSVTAGGGNVASSTHARRNGFAYLPRDRKSEGIFAPLSVADNAVISGLRRVSRFGVVRVSRCKSLARQLVTDLRVRTQSLSSPISSLSGGNQQKVLLARLLATQPRLLILNDPMRGVDLGAKRDLYDVLTQAAERGIAILLLSTELVELCLLCDRVAVFHNQEITRTIDRDELREDALIQAMFGLPDKKDVRA